MSTTHIISRLFDEQLCLMAMMSDVENRWRADEHRCSAVYTDRALSEKEGGDFIDCLHFPFLRTYQCIRHLTACRRLTGLVLFVFDALCCQRRREGVIVHPCQDYSQRRKCYW